LQVTDKELLVLDCYEEFTDVFLKEISDTFLLYCLYNYKIILEKPNNFRYSLLYKLTIKKLEKTKRYLLDNLNKGFLELS
jgi:hypothetical protein